MRPIRFIVPTIVFLTGCSAPEHDVAATLLLAEHAAPAATRPFVAALRTDGFDSEACVALGRSLVNASLVRADPMPLEVVLRLKKCGGLADGDRLEIEALRGLHRFDLALRQARERVDQDNANAQDYLLLGDVLTDRGSLKEAASAYQNALALRPGAAGYGRAAYLRYLLGDVRSAHEFNQMALLASRPDDAATRSWLLANGAFFALAHGDAETTVTLALESLKVRATPMAQLALARGHVALGNLDRAAMVLEELSSSYPSPQVLWLAAAVSNMRNDSSRARGMADLLRRSGARVDRRAYARWLIHVGRATDASTLVEHELAQRRDSDTLALGASLRVLRDDREGARALVDEALDQAPFAPSPWLHLTAAEVARDPAVRRHHLALAERYRFLLPPDVSLPKTDADAKAAAPSWSSFR